MSDEVRFVLSFEVVDDFFQGESVSWKVLCALLLSTMLTRYLATNHILSVIVIFSSTTAHVQIHKRHSSKGANVAYVCVCGEGVRRGLEKA